jgi:hypothetical protein
MWRILVMGRVKPSVTAVTAEASLNVTLNAAVRATMPVNKDTQIPRLLLRDGSRGQNPDIEDFEKPIYVLMALAALVLLLACADLANLLPTRASARKRKTSTRLAGLGPGRILRQMMTESLLLSLMSGVGGLLLAWTERNAMPRLLTNSWAPPAFSAKFSWPIFAFAAAISILTGIIFWLGARMAGYARQGEFEPEGWRTNDHASATGANRQGNRDSAGCALGAARRGSGSVCVDDDATGTDPVGIPIAQSIVVQRRIAGGALSRDGEQFALAENERKTLGSSGFAARDTDACPVDLWKRNEQHVCPRGTTAKTRRKSEFARQLWIGPITMTVSRILRSNKVILVR